MNVCMYECMSSHILDLLTNHYGIQCIHTDSTYRDADSSLIGKARKGRASKACVGGGVCTGAHVENSAVLIYLSLP